MTTTRHAAPWTFSRVLAMFTGKPARPGPKHPDLLTGREAVARNLYGEYVNWDAERMAEYDNFGARQVYWLTIADRRIATAPDLSTPDLHVARWWGYTPRQWSALPAIVKVDKRETFYEMNGVGA